MIKISIGLPVYNGENFIQDRIENILSQSYSNFELIISNNASIDSTDKICREFKNKDERIKYFIQEKNKGGLWNFQFVLNESDSDYFVWAGVDDVWDKDFLRENIEFLEKETNFVGSISQVDSFGELDGREISSNRQMKKIIERFRWSKYGVQEATGDYGKKVKTYLNRNSAQALYGIFRTNALKKSIVKKSFLGMDLAIILDVLKYGDLHVVQKKLIKFYRGGFSSKGINTSTKKLEHSLIGRVFPYYFFTKWCFKNLGKEIFLKNILHFFKLNLTGEFAIIYDIILSKK